ncbi:MAG: VIT domain-containing protein, partial [Planctomycetota bacterium]|nr:VIT domain-containing protein [Planctomycetota bacterium]
MNAHTCDDFELLMPDALTGRLAPSDAAAVEAHLTECSACREVYDEFKLTAAVLTGSFPARNESTRPVWTRVARSVQAQRAAPAGRVVWRTVSRAAAAVVAVAALTYVITAHSLKTSGPPGHAASGTPSVQLKPEVSNATPRPSPPTAPAPGPAVEQKAPGTAAVVAETRRDELELPPATAKSVADAPVPEVTTEHEGPVAIAAAREAAHKAAVVEPPRRPARESIDDALGLAVTRKTGPLAIYDPEHRAWRGLVAGERVPYGWSVRTGAGGKAELAFGESRVRLDENTALVIERRGGGARVANLSRGRVRVDLLRADAGFSICSAGGTVELTGTVVEVDSPASSLAFVRVLEGHVAVTAKVAQAAEPIKVAAAAGEETLLAFTATEQALRALPEAVRTRALKLAAKAGLVLPVQNYAANWDEELDRPRPRSAASVGQLIVKDEQGRDAEPLGILEMNVGVSIRGPEALTRVDQVFVNQTDRTLEGTFYFPLPPGAAISRYAMYVDDTTLIEGEVVERGKAREIYESILHAKRDPALLEWMEGNLFKTRIFPIAPRGRKRVILEYTELLPAFYDTRRYVLPLVSELTQKTAIGRLTVRADLATNDASSFSEIRSPSYPKDTAVAGVGSPRATAALTLHNCKPAADFVLTFSAPRPGELFSSAYAENGELPYLLLGYQPRPAPELLSGAAPGKRDVLFIVETSGARTPQDLDAQARVLQAMVAALSPEDDRLAVAAADVSLVPYVNEFVAPNAEALSAAAKALAQRAPLGALDMSATVRGAAEFVARSDRARRVSSD